MPQASLLTYFARVQPVRELEEEDSRYSGDKIPGRSCEEGDQDSQDAKPTNDDTSVDSDQSLSETPQSKTVQTLLPLQPYTLPNNPLITIQPVQSTHLPALARLTSTILPIPYQPSFYASTLTDDGSRAFSLEAVFAPPSPSSNPNPIGWIRCALHPIPPLHCPSPSPTPSEAQHDIYIKALLIHPAYRSLGIASAFLNLLLTSPSVTLCRVVQMSAHVWEENTEGLEWYAKRGFGRAEFVGGYYRKLKPNGAWLMRRSVGVSEEKGVDTGEGEVPR